MVSLPLPNIIRTLRTLRKTCHNDSVIILYIGIALRYLSVLPVGTEPHQVEDDEPQVRQPWSPWPDTGGGGGIGGARPSGGGVRPIFR